MNIVVPETCPGYLPDALWDAYQAAGRYSREPTLLYCQKLLFGEYSAAMFESMQSKNGGIAKDWVARQWDDWLLYASTTATSLLEKNHAEILKRRRNLLAEMEGVTGKLLDLMDEAKDLFMSDEVSMPDRAIGMDKASPPRDRVLFGELVELLADVQYEQALPVADWMHARDRRLARIANHEPRLRYVAAFVEHTKGCNLAVSDRALAYQCAALYGLSDRTGDGFDRLLQSVTKARRAHEKRMRVPEYCLVYFGDSKDGPRVMGYRPFSGDAAFSYWYMQTFDKRKSKGGKQLGKTTSGSL